MKKFSVISYKLFKQFIESSITIQYMCTFWSVRMVFLCPNNFDTFYVKIVEL